MAGDEHGLAVGATSDAALKHFDQAVDDLLNFRPEVAAESRSVLAEDPDWPMGNVLAAYLAVLATEPDDTRRERRRFAAFRTRVDERALPPRERAHVAAAQVLLNGDLLGAGRLLAQIVAEHPRDALALAAGHQIDFLTGDARMLRDRIGGALSAWHEDEDRHYGHILGMYAFGLEEAGHYDRSEETGLRAVELNPRDVWAIHAVAHTYEMQGRFGDGVRLLDERRDDWATGTFFNVHTWWHYALYALEAGATGRALEIYDAVLHGPDTSESALELVDASALLWRMYLDGHDQTARWRALADAWAAKTAEPFSAFNDAHAVMAYVGAGRIADAEALIRSRETYAEWERPAVTNHAMTVRVGLPVCRALVAYGRGDHERVVELLHPIRHRVHEFGGSHAQRDAVQKTLLESALRAGRLDLARLLISERTSVRPSSPFNWLKHADLARRLGDAGLAASSTARATELVREAALPFPRPR
ncbi:tetratricopeptide (TPR) repeat protein [Thermocatellispora tengchongensis]|uniref:Tetratricopeptide repeat protein 38 n=1 Tax=Thermocatellispora tengchongensis TaxID=1073253 RepID=A0A840P4M5_9ACTN|nr:tetratricopeptide repeat protein [Thermocatellispora tengchongensis]MBB5133456.1 tetratricopeptide (TPR) repeat protein [Thermocatellispora tengchongensis]